MQASDDPQKAARPRSKKLRNIKGAVAIGAAVVLVLLLIFNPWGDDGSSGPFNQVVAAKDAQKASAKADQGSVSVVRSKSQGRAALKADGLAPLEDGKVYQAWFLDADGSATAAGILDAKTAEGGSMLLDGNPQQAASVGLSIEPSGGSAQPTTEMVVVVRFG